MTLQITLAVIAFAVIDTVAVAIKTAILLLSLCFLGAVPTIAIVFSYALIAHIIEVCRDLKENA